MGSVDKDSEGRFRVKRVGQSMDIREIDLMTKVVKKKLVSSVDHPLYLSYGGEGICLPPKGTILNINPNKLGSLPKGASLVDMRKD